MSLGWFSREEGGGKQQKEGERGREERESDREGIRKKREKEK